MIFRRSLVRELDRDGDRPLRRAAGDPLHQFGDHASSARAAGGAVATDGVLALIGFNAMFYLNLLLSVALFLTVLLTLSRWYRDSEMVVWFTSGQSLTALPEAHPVVRRTVPAWRSCCFRFSSRRGPSSASSNTNGNSSPRDEITILSPGLFREFRRAGIVVYVESINPVDGRIRNVFLHSVDDDKDTTTVARLGHLVESPERRPLRGARGRPPLRGQARARPTSGLIEFDKLGRRIEPAELRALPTSNKAIPRPRCSSPTAVPSAPSSSGACRCRSGVPAHAARHSAVLRQSAHGTLVQPHRGSVPLHALHQLHQHRAEHDRAGRIDLWTALLIPHTIAALLVFLLFQPPAVDHRALPPGTPACHRDRPSPSRSMRTLTRYIGRDVLVFDPAAFFSRC